MGIFFEKYSSQSKTQKILISSLFLLIVLDLINNFLLHMSWLSNMIICLYIVFIILFTRSHMRRKEQ